MTRTRITHPLALLLAALVFGLLAPIATQAQPNGWVKRADSALQPGSGPPPLQLHAMAYDTARGVTVLYGGQNNVIPTSQTTWEWDGTVWTAHLVSGPAPSPRYFHAMAYDKARAVTVLFGGYNESLGISGETWEWNGTTWTQPSITGPSPSPRYTHSMAYDAARGVTVMFGGYNPAAASSTRHGSGMEPFGPSLR